MSAPQRLESLMAISLIAFSIIAMLVFGFLPACVSFCGLEKFCKGELLSPLRFRHLSEREYLHRGPA